VKAIIAGDNSLESSLAAMTKQRKLSLWFGLFVLLWQNDTNLPLGL